MRSGQNQNEAHTEECKIEKAHSFLYASWKSSWVQGGGNCRRWQPVRPCLQDTVLSVFFHSLRVSVRPSVEKNSKAPGVGLAVGWGWCRLWSTNFEVCSAQLGWNRIFGALGSHTKLLASLYHLVWSIWFLFSLSRPPSPFPRQCVARCIKTTLLHVSVLTQSSCSGSLAWLELFCRVFAFFFFLILQRVFLLRELWSQRLVLFVYLKVRPSTFICTSMGGWWLQFPLALCMGGWWLQFPLALSKNDIFSLCFHFSGLIQEWQSLPLADPIWFPFSLAEHLCDRYTLDWILYPLSSR